MVIKTFDPPFIISDFDFSQLCAITFRPHYITSQFHSVLSDHPSIQACSFIFMISCKNKLSTEEFVILTL